MGVVTTAKLVFFLLCLTTTTSTAAAQNLKTYSKSFPSFNDSLKSANEEYLLFENNARNYNDALQITPDSANPGVYPMENQSGRVMLKQPFKLHDRKANNSVVASFNTSFLVNIFPGNQSTSAVGEGLAFLIAPDFTIPANSHGQYLGLTNATTDGTAHGIVAVELDTVKQDFDPDDNHIGLDINSVRSNVTVSLAQYGRLASPPTAAGPPRFHNVWVNYDGVEKVIRVYIAHQAEKSDPTPPMPATPVLERALDLSEYVAETSYFGFSASTGDQTELNCVLRWNFTINYFPGPKSPLLKISLGAGIPVVVLLVAAVLVVIYLYKKKLIGRSDSNILSRLRTLPGMPREFSYAELKKATNNFEEKRKLGQGGFGVVYKGVLPGENYSEVAVKMFSREALKGEDDFLAELTIINRLRHKHLVKLLGWCHKNGKLLLVYEYMPNGSLDMHLYADERAEPLGWNLRYKILSGVASALHYLHYEYDQKVVHRDIKSSNIMLDSNFNARLGDFGLARALENEKTSYAEAEGGVLGTMGYIAPECFHTGKNTQQSDVYAFGAVLTEVVCGLRPNVKINKFQFLVDWVWSLHREGCLLEAVDKRLGDDYVAEEAQRLLLLGLACSHPIASERPKTHAIVQMISGAVPVPMVPPFKPSFVWPAMGPISDMTDATTIDTSPLSPAHYGSDLDSTPRSLVREDYSGYTDHSMV